MSIIVGQSTIGEFSTNPNAVEPCGNIPIGSFNHAGLR